MNHSPEHDTDALLETLLPRVDPERKGTFVEIGCGTSNFSFVMARALGYKGLATDPILMPQCVTAALYADVHLDPYAITDHDGYVDLYLHKDCDANFASVLPSWMEGAASILAPCRKLETWLRDTGTRAIACLKLDVEGAENIILRQLSGLPAVLLPKIVVFEYGGGSNRSEGKGGWTTEHYVNTMECWKLLLQNGYSLHSRFDSNVGPLAMDDSVTGGIDAVLPPDAHYGNLVFVRD